MRLAGHAFGSVRGLAPAGDSVAGRYFALTTLTPSCMNPLHRRREMAWPTLSTAGTRKAERQSYRGRCRYEPSDLLDVERRVLECLGAALSQRME